MIQQHAPQSGVRQPSEVANARKHLALARDAREKADGDEAEAKRLLAVALMAVHDLKLGDVVEWERKIWKNSVRIEVTKRGGIDGFYLGWEDKIHITGHVLGKHGNALLEPFQIDDENIGRFRKVSA